MSRTWTPLLFACLTLSPSAPAAAPPAPPGKDRFGDPLPPRALARAGTVRLRHAGIIRAARFGADGKTVTSFCDDDFIRVWDVSTGKEIAARPRLGFRLDLLECVTFSADGKLLVIGCDDGKDDSSDGLVLVCDAGSGKELLRLTVPQAGTIYSVAASRDGKLVAAGDEGGTVRVWTVKGGLSVSRIEWDKGMVTGLAFSPDGRTLAAGNGEDAVALWDAVSGKRLRELKKTWQGNVQLNSDFESRLAFSPDGRTLLTANSDWGVRLWDVRTGKVLKEVVPARRGGWTMHSDVEIGRAHV